MSDIKSEGDYGMEKLTYSRIGRNREQTRDLSGGKLGDGIVEWRG